MAAFSRSREPLVSVIMPAFHAKALVPDAVSSLIDQTYTNWELLFVSDDGEDYMLPGDSRIRQYRSPGYASGPGTARNVGLRQAKGSLIAHLDADDLFHRQRLEKLVPPALEHGIALDNMRILDFGSGAAIGRLFGPRRTGLDFDSALELNYPIFPVYRKDMLSEWDEDIFFAEDVLFNLRAISRGAIFPVLNSPLMDYRVRQGSISCSGDSCLCAEDAYSAILSKLDVSDLGFSPSRKEPVRKMFERKAGLNRAFLNLKGELDIKSFAEYASILDAGREVQQNIACS